MPIKELSNEILIATIASTQQYLNELRDERDERACEDDDEPDEEPDQTEDYDDDGNPEEEEKEPEPLRMPE